MPDKTVEVASGEFRRFQEVAPGEYAEEVYMRDLWNAAVGRGRAYIIGTGRLELAIAGNLRATIRNPSVDTAVIVAAIAGLATATGWATIFEDPTAGLPATAARPRMRVNPLEGTAGVTEVKADTDATTPLSGGTDTGVVLGVGAGDRFSIPIGMVIPPGATRGLNISYAGAATVAAAVYVAEE